MLHNSKFADDTDETDETDEADDADDADDADANAAAGLVMSFRARVKTRQFLNNYADFERW
jgi:hypothetical protein